MKNRPVLVWTLFALAFSLSACHRSESPDLIRIAAAAVLRAALPEIEAAFSKTHPDYNLETIYGSSGKFRAQIANGAPYDLFFSADMTYPENLYRTGLTATPVIAYGVGRIVLWSRSARADQLALTGSALTPFQRIAVANPRLAPYGERAMEAITASGLRSQIEARLVFGENIAQTLQLVESGAADAGFISLTQALQPAAKAMGHYHLIDNSLHAPLKQGFVVTKRAAQKKGAHALADFVQSEAARAIFEKHGLSAP